MNFMPSKFLLILTILIGFIFPESSSLADLHGHAHHLHIDGSSISIFWILPFLGILLSIAIFPLISPEYWHHNYGKVSAFWGLLFIVLFTWNFGYHISIFYVIEVYLKEFIPFIVILFALYTVSGGVLISGNMQGTPQFNTTVLIIGTLLASWMGTTGASMLLIRPLIRANLDRKIKTHIFVFFIFLVSNIGGALTPLGDPPLFLGFLKGVDFFWTTTNLIFPLIYVSIPMIILFFIIDNYFYSSESISLSNEKFKLKVEGKNNLLLIFFIIISVVISGVWKADPSNEANWFIEYGNECIMTYGTFLQVSLLLLIAYISLKTTPSSIRLKNDFTWEPVMEVTKLFATIFITMVPAIAMLKAGLKGPLNKIITLLTNSDGDSINFMYFWVTGILSSFLDNAPTYLVFFETAGGNATILMNENAETLIAISAGAVFMGAMSYIGNAPNFMVKSIAEQNKIKMPSFFGYMAWSVVLLVPVLIIFSLIYFS